MQEQRIISYIHQFVDIPVNQIQEFIGNASTSSFKKGEYFVTEGQVCSKMIFLKSGLMRYMILNDGKDLTKDFGIDHSNPFCTSYTSFFNKTPSEIYIEAMEDCEVLTWSRDYLIPMLEADLKWQTWSQRMAAFLFMRKEQREIAFLKHKSEERYLQFLKDFRGLDERIPQHYIASYLGITPETLSRLRRSMPSTTNS